MTINLDDLIPDNVKDPSKRETPKAWSPYQQDIFTAVKDKPVFDTEDTTVQQYNNLMVQAVAGSGKTTTIVEGMRYAGAASQCLFVAFNKSIADTLAMRVPPGAGARTFNSCGNTVLRRILPPKAKLDNWKNFELLKPHTRDRDLQQAIARSIGLAKHRALGILEQASADWFRNCFSDDIFIETTDIEYAADVALSVFNESTKPLNTFDFDDQVYLPVSMNKNCFTGFDTIFVDEAQDLSPIQHLMLARAEARVIAVGDRAQAIYGFRGADDSSMDTMRRMFAMRELPLSITYRCPQRVVAEAQRYVPHIQAAPSAPEGRVEELEQLPLPEEYPSDSMVLCRNNAPLFALGLEFLRRRVPCRLMTNFGAELIKLVNRLDGTSARDAYKYLCKWRDEQLAKATTDSRVSAVQDRFNCLEPFFKDPDYKLKSQIVVAIQSLIDSTQGTRICTIHKSKGLEAKHVFFEQPELLRSGEGQENNLYYVAVTRALESLSFRRGEPR